MADSLSLSRNIQLLFETLRSKSPHRGSQAAQLASDLYTLCIESVSSTELAYCSSVLFNKENGILKFLKETATLEEFVGCKEKLLELLSSFIGILDQKILPYALEIKEVCVTLFSRDKTSKVKNATFPPLIEVLRLCRVQSPLVDSLKIPKLADKYFQACLQPTKHTATVRAGIFQLLGSLCEAYPEHMVTYSERLVGIYTRTLKAEMLSKSKKKPEMPVIGGCLRGLCSYLINFSQSVAEGSAYAQDIYKFTRMAIDPEVSLTRYEVPRAGLSLIAKHAAQFKEYLAKDYQHMYKCLFEWCGHNNRENKQIALTALDAFLRQVSIHIVEGASKDRQTNITIFRDFIKKFREIIDSKTSGHRELAVAIKGYGYFAAPCKIFMKPEDVQFMFSEMVQRSEQLFFSPVESSDDRLLFHLPSFLEALASIVKEMEELSESFLLSLEKLLVLLFECFPLIPPIHHKPTYYAVVRMVMGIASSRTTLKTFLSHVVYQGLIRTCSHPVVVDVGDGGMVVSVEGEGGDLLGGKRASYQDYVDLWVHLMDPTQLKSLSMQLKDQGLRQLVHQILYNEVVSAIIRIIHRLDLSSKSPLSAAQETPESPTPSPSEAAAAAATSDPISGLQPSVPKDFLIFINLVDLCRTLLPKVQPQMFEQWVHTFGCEVIVQSSRLPLVSGFYKLLATCLKICKTINYFKDASVDDTVGGDVVAMETDATDKQACFILFRKFVKEVLVRMRQYKDDLLASCLQLLLSLPNELVRHEFQGLVPALQTTFKLGLSYLSLANAGLDALEAWNTQLPAEFLKPHFKHILPYLDDYLKTLGTADSQSEGGTVTVSARSARGGRVPVKVLAQWKEGIEGAESPQSKVRSRIVHFLGSLGGEINAGLVESESAASYAAKAVAWDSRNRLELALPFQDMKPSLFLDPFLPRVCELAVSSSDRQTKVAACELLHAMVLFLIGRSAQPAMQKKSPMTKLYRKVFPYVLQLACDVEKVAEQLFHPLVFQMIHWFTRNTQYESPDTIALLDAILDGVIHPTNTSLRDFSALCVKEFFVWSIKQTTKRQQERSPINTKSLLKRLYSLASHPSAAKRLGAALTFNSIYTVFREEESLVDLFVIEMLVVNIHSLKLAHKDDKSLGTQEQTCQAIGHLTRIIRVKAPLLNTPNKNRRVPKGLKVAEMATLMSWLLLQCGSPETEARQQCMTLFIQFAPLLPKIPNARTWIRKTMESEGGFYFVTRFEKGGHGRGGIQRQPVLSGGVFSLSESVAWFESLLATLDCYNWMLREQLIAPSEVLQTAPQKPSDKPSCLFQSLEFFITQLALGGIEAATQCYTSPYSSVHTPREEEEYNRAKCAVVLRVLKLVAVLLSCHPKEAFSHVPHTFWSEELLRLVTSCCLQPTSVGFDTGDMGVMETLPQEVLETLKAFAKHLPPELKASFISIVSSEISPGGGGSCDLIGQLPLYFHGNDEQGRDRGQLNSTVKGHLLLQKAGLLVPTIEAVGHTADSVVHKLLDSVLGTLKPLVSHSPGSGGSGVGLLSPASEQSVGLLLELTLEIGITSSVLVGCLLDYSSDCTGLGLMLYQSFPHLLNTHVVTQHQQFLANLMTDACKKPETVSAVLNGFLEHLSRDKTLRKRHASQVCGCLLSQWSKLGAWWGEMFSADQRLGAVNLLKKLLSLEPKLLVQASPAELEPVLSMYLTLLEETQSSLTFKSKVLEVLHHFTGLPEEHLKRLKASINKLTAQQFPLKSTEFPPGSPQFNEYISVIDKLLSALVISGSLVLLEVLISVMCREQKHVHEEQIQASLVKFITDLPSGAAKSAIDVSYRVFANEQGYPPEARRAAAERVCMTLLKSCSEVALQEFFLEHIGEIMAIIEANLSKSSQESQLVSKLCCFQFVEVLYSRLPAGALTNPEGKINSAYCRGPAKTGKEMTQAVTKAGHTVKSEDLHGDKTLLELRRVYHCMAYNMLVAVITCTQSKMQFYTGFLFKEDITKGQFLWDNLIDHDKLYHFETEFESPLDRKKQMTAIRDEIHAEGSRESSPTASPPFPPRYLSSQYLADSSLSTDISQFDFSSGTQAFPTVNIGSPSESKEASYVLSEEQIEQDELNTHECMLPLMRLLDHMQHNRINPEVPKGTTPDEMPSWMAALHKKLNNSPTHQNVRLFIARLVTNRPKIFQPYARYWLPGLVQLVVGGAHGGEGLHYFVVDLLVTILSWSTTSVLEDQYLAKRLLEYVMEHCHHENRSVFRNNLEITRTLMECWKDKLQVPTKTIYNNFCNPNPDSKANRTGIQLLGIVVANKMPPYDSATAGTIDEQKFYVTFVSTMSHKYKEVHAASAEVLGMVLAYMEEQQHYTLDNLQELAVQQLMALASDRNEDKFLICLHKIQLNYPKITERFVEKLLFLLPNFQGVFRSMCLEVLHPQADIRPDLYRELRDKGFHSMLTHRDEPTQQAALRIVQGMLRHFDQEQTYTLLPLITAFGTHSSQSCRLLMYDILIWIYNNMCPSEGGSRPSEGGSLVDEATKKLVADVRDQLLQGLADDAETIRLKMYAFWNEESRLASDTLGRLTQLLAVLYSTGTERQFLYHSTNLLLELTSRSPDFNRSIFDSPLSECKFEEYTSIDLSWQQRHLQMTPLFAATLASPPGQTQSEATSGMGEGMLRATQQAAAFTPTQGGSSYNWMAPSLQSQDPSFTVGSVEGTQPSASSSGSLHSSLLFSKMKPPKRPLRAIGPGEGFGKERLKPDDTATQDPQEQQRREIMKLKRRFLRDRKITSTFFAKTEAKKKIIREEHRRHQKAARDSRVVMYRKYRVGELPDIQIKHSELIRPFQALAQRDSSLARMLFASLFESVFAEVDHVLTDREAESTKKAVRDGLNAVMEASTLFHPPFIGSLQDICFTEKQLDLSPTAVSTASLTSKQELIGIMLLEKQLLCNVESTRPAKRARGAATPLPESTITWVELARLYKSLGDYDVLHGVFSQQIGTKPITREAMEAEERRDYFEALRLYKEAVACESWTDGSPTQVEEDLWDDSMLECYSHLTEWSDLEKAALVNVDDSSTPKLQKLWEDSYYHEHYLPHVMHSKLKLACSGVDDPNFSTFLDKALQDPDKKTLLESRYSHELALYSILKDDLDRARYYTGNCLQSFLQDWSNLDQLLVKSRAAQLQGLQSLTEMQEYLSLMADSAHFENTRAVDALLTSWRSRFPHPKLDPINVWDDIVTSRCMMMRKLLEHVHNNPASAASATDSMEVDGTEGVDLSGLQEKFSREFTTLYLRVADSARQQSNYAVAVRYLKLTESAINEHFTSDVELRLRWLHSVAEMRVQQVEQDPSPTKIEPLVTLVDRIGFLGKETVLSSNHALARRHHLLEGHVFNQLASAFKEEGSLLLDILPDSCMKQLRCAIGVQTSAQPPPNEISHKLLLRALTSLKQGVKSGTAEHKATGDSVGMVQALVDVANFCDRALRAKEDEDSNTPLDVSQFPSVVVTYSLKAMQFGSDAATQQFPRLLQLVELYPDTMDAFKKKSLDVPNWKFIAWISQMVALLDKHEGAAVHNLLLSIATDYPQALCYPFKISSSNFKFDSTSEGKANRAAVEKLKAKVDSRLISDFVAALELLSPPELRLKDFVENEVKPILEQTVTQRNVTLLKEAWKSMYSQLLDYHAWDTGPSSSLFGSGATPSLQVGPRQKKFAQAYVKKLEDKFGRDGSKVAKMKVSEFNNHFNLLYESMRAGLNKTAGTGLLKDYSPWLHNFQANAYPESIEIPGQYDGKSKPLPDYHVRISGFDEKVLIMNSIRKPKRLTIRGDDEKEYMFLVKGGEDLRMDQRIEQLFSVMNKILLEDSACSQRGLKLKTYEVIPMTPRVGLIEWVENTKPLKDFLQDALSEEERKHFSNGSKWHTEWLGRYGKNNADMYKNMYRKASRTEVEREYRKKVTSAPWDLLRRAFMQLAASPEAFLTLRSHFIRTMASVSSCQYVLGIGDRHLSNFMVDLENGGIVGIDFGHNFGTATQFLPFPELMPFRLTPQITQLLLPHSESGQLRSCMVHTLRALHNSPEVLLNTMDVFVKEPSLDWKSNARKQAKMQKLNEETHSQEGTWYPREKLKQAEKKLLGYNPAHIMRTDLRLGHHKTQEYPALEAILMGDKKYNKRACVGERCNSVEEQVECLLDHATDPNILGRVWGGWEPWV